jgi:peptide-methionine (S)-S-oxide reductase
VFWTNHDPPTLNRQGPDRGTQYRSAIFYRDESQRIAAEECHQRYLEKHGLASCHLPEGRTYAEQ